MAAMAAMAALLRSSRSLSAIANRADLLPKRGVSIVERCPVVLGRERFGIRGVMSIVDRELAATDDRGFAGSSKSIINRGCLLLGDTGDRCFTGNAKTSIVDRSCLSLAASRCQISGLAGERKLGITVFTAGSLASGADDRRLMVELKHGSPVGRGFSSEAIDPRKHSVCQVFQNPVVYMSRRTFIEMPMPSPEAAASFLSMLQYPIQWIKMYITKEDIEKWIEAVKFGEKIQSAVGTFFMMLNKMKEHVGKGLSWISMKKDPAVMGNDKKDQKKKREFKVSMSFKYKEQ